MRGEAATTVVNGNRYGITPAHAGRSERRCHPVRDGQDHPRACGEKCTTFTRRIMTAGSPPRMRGEAPSAPESEMWLGITPAHAGRSLLECDVLHLDKDHPRACGEKLSLSSHHKYSTGSPPRMRGEVTRLCGRGHNNRDHPRACGEKLVTGSVISSATGSPPRMRGEACCHVQPSTYRRITPAHAGRSTCTC